MSTQSKTGKGILQKQFQKKRIKFISQTATMKQLLSTLVFLCSLQFAIAQNIHTVSDTIPYNLQNQLLLPKMKIAKTEKGTVYLLPQDRMPVLVPDNSMNYHMPAKNLNANSTTQIPNPYYPYRQFNIQPKPGYDFKIEPTMPFKKRSDEKENLRKD